MILIIMTQKKSLTIALTIPIQTANALRFGEGSEVVLSRAPSPPRFSSPFVHPSGSLWIPHFSNSHGETKGHSC